MRKETRSNASTIYVAACLLGWLILFVSSAAAQEIRLYISSQAGDRLRPQPALHFEQRPDSRATTVEIDDKLTYQKIDGFGASLLEAGLMSINRLPAEEQENVFRALFDPKEGAGFS